MTITDRNLRHRLKYARWRRTMFWVKRPKNGLLGMSVDYMQNGGGEYALERLREIHGYTNS